MSKERQIRDMNWDLFQNTLKYNSDEEMARNTLTSAPYN